MIRKHRIRQLTKELKKKTTSVNKIIKTDEWSVVFIKTTHEEPFIELVNNFCRVLRKFEEHWMKMKKTKNCWMSTNK